MKPTWTSFTGLGWLALYAMGPKNSVSEGTWKRLVGSRAMLEQQFDSGRAAVVLQGLLLNVADRLALVMDEGLFEL